MNEKFICMDTRFRPEEYSPYGEEYLDARAFPAGRYPLEKITDLFLSLFAARVNSIERQALDVQLDLYGGEGPGRTILRAFARLGGPLKLEARLYGTEAPPDGIDGGTDVLPDGIPEFRRLDSIGDSGWDVIHHGDAYPSGRSAYEAAVTDFLRGKFVGEDRKNPAFL